MLNVYEWTTTVSHDWGAIDCDAWEYVVFCEPFPVMNHIVDVWKLCKPNPATIWSFHMGIRKGQHKNVLLPWIPNGILTGYGAKLWMATVITLVNSARAWTRSDMNRRNERKSTYYLGLLALVFVTLINGTNLLSITCMHNLPWNYCHKILFLIHNMAKPFNLRAFDCMQWQKNSRINSLRCVAKFYD